MQPAANGALVIATERYESVESIPGPGNLGSFRRRFQHVPATYSDMYAYSDEIARVYRSQTARRSNLKAPGMVSSRRQLSSCHGGELWVNLSSPTWSAFLLVAAIAAGWLALRQVGEVEIDHGLERFGHSAVDLLADQRVRHRVEKPCTSTW
jgi:hypothetical protein